MLWLFFAAAFLVVLLATRLRDANWRRSTQGLAVLLALIGTILLLRAPGGAFPLPGARPRPWYQP